MQHILFNKNLDNQYDIALLIKTAAFNNDKLIQHYINPLKNRGINDKRIIAFDLQYNQHNKAPVKFIKAYLATLLQGLNNLKVKTLFVADASYFKVLTGAARADPHLGYVLPCKLKGYEHIKVILSINHTALFYNPTHQSRLTLSINTLIDHLQGKLKMIGEDIIHDGYYPRSLNEIHIAIRKLHNYPVLTVDIETFSLKFHTARIGTISFAWDEHNGIAFKVDYCTQGVTNYLNARKKPNSEIKKYLKEFFDTYQGKLIYHNANFDIKILTYELYMSDLADIKGKLEGIEILTRNIEDTKIITYLATNTTADNKLGLKENTHEFAGNYVQENIKDIRYIEQTSLLRYNLTDCLATWYLYKKNKPKLLRDAQEAVYENIFLPSIATILDMELSGMPISMSRVTEVEGILRRISETHQKLIHESHIIEKYTLKLRKMAWIEKNLLLKVKVRPLSDFSNIVFNPNSGKQLIKLLYKELDLPVLDLTNTGLPATKSSTLEKLKYQTSDPNILELLDSLIEFNKVEKILTTFITAFFTNSVMMPDGSFRLFGNFNLGGTKSGRLSSSKPNLQQIPNGSTYGKLIKSCFVSTEHKIFAGADFDSLEDKISALTTKDPNKLKVYTDGYDGHCLRAYSYFGKHMPDIVNTVDSINSIKTKYPVFRQDSKAPTFACTYLGTWRTLVKNLGMTPEEAQEIEDNYHELYKVSDEWVRDKLEEAHSTGYVTVAFGLRLRTPILEQTIMGLKNTPHEAGSEERTAGNALGQSFGMLTNRAANEFRDRVLASPYRLDIELSAMIHDAIYVLCTNSVGCITWTNKNLIECMEWQELEEIQHDQVKLSAKLELNYPDWSTPITIPNNISYTNIYKMVNKL